MGKGDDLKAEAAHREAEKAAQVKRVGELRDKGWTIEAIAGAVGISKSSVKRHLLTDAARRKLSHDEG